MSKDQLELPLNLPEDFPGEIQVLDREEILTNPNLFQALVDFQYGKGETYRRGAQILDGMQATPAPGRKKQ